jgi:aconitate hydratase
VRAVIAQSFERIHRSNLVGMGILPLQFKNGESAESLGLTGDETYNFSGIATLLGQKLGADREITVRAVGAGSKITEFKALARIDTPQEALYYQHGGILQYVLRQLLAGKEKPDVVSKGMATMADPATGSSIS